MVQVSLIEGCFENTSCRCVWTRMLDALFDLKCQWILWQFFTHENCHSNFAFSCPSAGLTFSKCIKHFARPLAINFPICIARFLGHPFFKSQQKFQCVSLEFGSTSFWMLFFDIAPWDLMSWKIRGKMNKKPLVAMSFRMHCQKWFVVREPQWKFLFENFRRIPQLITFRFTVKAFFCEKFSKWEFLLGAQDVFFQESNNYFRLDLLTGWYLIYYQEQVLTRPTLDELPYGGVNSSIVGCSHFAGMVRINQSLELNWDGFAWRKSL